MVFTDISLFEQEGRRNANITAITAAVLLIALLFLNLPFTPPPTEEELNGGGGVTVALGWPDMGSNNDAPSDGGGEEVPMPPTPSPTPAPAPTPSPSSPPNIVTGDNAEVDFAVKKQKEEQKQRLKEIDDQLKVAKVKAEADAAVRRQAEAKAQAEADAERQKQEAINKKKSGIGDLFKKPGSAGGTGTGSGNSGKPGNGGRPDGDPNEKNLEGNGGSGGGSGGGIGTGVGRSVGGGLGGRAVKSASQIPKTYNENGTVVVKVCVDASGEVTTATVSNIGTTTSSTTLRNLAIQNAKSLRFAAGDSDQCGTVNYSFKVK
jgi:outer membrane biosynthesis protein TonB